MKNKRGTITGASLVSLPAIGEDTFLKDAAVMAPLEGKNEGQYVLGKEGKGYIYFSETGEVQLDLQNDPGEYSVSWIGPFNGEVQAAGNVVLSGSIVIKAPVDGPAIAWLKKH